MSRTTEQMIGRMNLTSSHLDAMHLINNFINRFDQHNEKIRELNTEGDSNEIFSLFLEAWEDMRSLRKDCDNYGLGV